MKTNFDTITGDDALITKVRDIQRASNRAFEHFEDTLSHNLCMISHFTGVKISN